jgi:sulfotransferase famil protein
MPVMVKGRRSVLFVHIPKTGGTTVERLFSSAGWTTHLRRTRRTDPELFELLRCSPQHLHAEVLRDLFKLRQFDVVFSVVRDPVDRFRSEFAHRHSGQLDSTQADADTVSAWADQAFARWERNPYILDNHLRPQTEFLVPRSRTYRFEDGLGAMVTDLNDRFDLGLPRKIPHRMSSERLGLPSSAVQVSPGLRARLRVFYAADYTALGYPG